jgi:hypothetical protein
MSTSARKIQPPLAKAVSFGRGRIIVRFEDGRELSVPLKWFPRLARASAQQRAEWRLIGGGIGVHWPLLDEDISVENLLLGAH